MLLGFSLPLNKQHTYSISVDLIVTIEVTHLIIIVSVSTEMRYTCVPYIRTEKKYR